MIAVSTRCKHRISVTMLDKKTLRRSLLAARAALPDDQRRTADMRIAQQLRDWLSRHPVQTLGVYWPMRGEPDLRILYADWEKLRVRLALPLVVQPDAPLEFAAWAPGESLVQDAFGVAIPAERVIARPDALLIPCVGFNPGNFRLGYGGGFYDRTLAVMPRPLALGIAYQCTLAEFDSAPHDIALDAVITECGMHERAPRR